MTAHEPYDATVDPALNRRDLVAAMAVGAAASGAVGSTAFAQGAAVVPARGDGGRDRG